jgi:phenylacetate-coenzyme A ligase PaaK-like adenylate-forming protein
MEVALQEVTSLYFPQREHLLWSECYARYEYAIRAIKGRWNKHEPITIIRIKPNFRNDVVTIIEELSAEQKVLVIDESHDNQLDILIQCMDRSCEIQYYRAPAHEEQNLLFQELNVMLTTNGYITSEK